MRLQQIVEGLLAGCPGRLGGHPRRIETVQIAAAGQCVRILRRIGAVAGRYVAAGQCGEQLAGFLAGIQTLVVVAGEQGDLLVLGAQAGWQLGGLHPNLETLEQG